MSESKNGKGKRGWTIQEAAEQTGLSEHTLRFYERAGLIDRVGRDDSSGHRRYTEEDITRVTFLMKLRATGMPIREMQRFVQLYREGDATLNERCRLLEDHRCTVRQRIEELQQSLSVIEFKIAMYTRQDAEKSGKDNNEC